MEGFGANVAGKSPPGGGATRQEALGRKWLPVVAIGAQIVRRAVEHPLRMLCTNAGVEGAVVVGEVIANKGNYGYNVATEKYEDLVKAGVVDPTKVTRTALQNAASIAGLLLTTECMITDLPEKEKAPAGGPPGGGMGGMDY